MKGEEILNLNHIIETSRGLQIALTGTPEEKEARKQYEERALELERRRIVKEIKEELERKLLF